MICFLVCINNLSAQDKNDVVFMLNGDKNEGKVVSVSGNTVKFKFHGEDLEYEFKKENINTIEFASGRTQEFTAATTAAPAVAIAA
jgi:hypothetical protein